MADELFAKMEQTKIEILKQRVEDMKEVCVTDMLRKEEEINQMIERHQHDIVGLKKKMDGYKKQLGTIRDETRREFADKARYLEAENAEYKSRAQNLQRALSDKAKAIDQMTKDIADHRVLLESTRLDLEDTRLRLQMQQNLVALYGTTPPHHQQLASAPTRFVHAQTRTLTSGVGKLFHAKILTESTGLALYQVHHSTLPSVNADLYDGDTSVLLAMEEAQLVISRSNLSWQLESSILEQSWTKRGKLAVRQDNKLHANVECECVSLLF